MAETEAKPRWRRRWRRIVSVLLLALALLTGVAALALHRYTRPQRLTALLIEQARSQFGLDLAVGGAAGFDFLPKLQLLLPKPTLKSADGSVLLQAESIGVAVPWHTVWGERVEIERLRIEKPRLDLDVLSRWLAARPAGGATPDVRFDIEVLDGSLLASAKPLVEGLNLHFANSGDLAVWFARTREANASLLPPLVGEVRAGSVQIGATRIEGLRVEARDDAAPKR